MRSVHDNQKSISLSLDALVHFKAALHLSLVVLTETIVKKQGNWMPLPLIPEEKGTSIEDKDNCNGKCLRRRK